MKKLIVLVVLVVIGFMFSGCSDMNQDITSANQVDKIPKPFWGNLDGVAISIGGGPGPFDPIKKQNTFSGTALHTGKYDCVLYYWIQLTSLSGGILYEIDGTDAILTAANGDEIWFNGVSGVWSFREGNPGVPGIVDATIHVPIVGGTGRFANATGFIDAVVEQEYTPGVDPTPTYGTWTGQIQY